MLKKAIIYLYSGGFNEVLRYATSFLRKRFFYTSRTIYLYRNLMELPAADYIDHFEFKAISTPDDLESLNFKRIETLDYQQWFSKGSIAIVGFYNGKPVSFSWCHFKSHQVDHSTRIDLGDNAVWIGPTFVDKIMRGKGMNKSQISYQIANLPTNISTCLTSANERNTASIKSFERLGFSHGAVLVQHQGIFSQKICERTFLDNGESFIRFVSNE